VSTTGYGQNEARRKKWLKRLVVGGLTAAAATVAVAYWLGRSRQEPLPGVPQNLPANVQRQLSGYTFTLSNAGQQVFTVHAARTVAFKRGGTTVLDDVWVEVFGREGTRHDILRTRECDYNPKSGDLYSAGRVEIELNAPGKGRAGPRRRSAVPIELETSQLSFRRQGSQVVTDQPVRFTMGLVSGTARGMVYATRVGSLELRQDVRMEMRPRGGRAPQLTLRLSAGHLRYEKATGEVALAGKVEITQGARRVQAESGRVLLDKQNRVTRAELDGNVRVLGAAGGLQIEGEAERLWGEFDPVSGELRRLLADGQVSIHAHEKGATSNLTAQRVELNLAGAHALAQNGLVTGNVQAEIESSPALDTPSANGSRSAAEKKVLTTGQLNFTLRPDGKSLREVATQGAGRLVVIPADRKTGERIITAGQFRMAFNARSRLETLSGLAPTHIIFRPPPNARPGSTMQETFADGLKAEFDPGTQMLRDVEQSGNFRFRDGQREASAENADYAAGTQILTLSGKPRLWDPQNRLTCERLRIDMGTDTAEGVGKVQGTHLDEKGGEPTHVLADRMVAEQRSQVVHYAGHVRAWRGADVIETSSLDVYRTQRRMSSDSDVLTSHLQPAALVAGAEPVAGSKRETRPVTIRANRLEYFDQGSKASYQGHVRLQTEDTTLDADRLDVWFSGAAPGQEPEVDRAVADGHVRVVQPGRRAQGNHAEYFASTGKIVLTGGPPELYDAERGYTTGQRLTFFIRDDRLFVDGGDQSPSLSKHRVAQ
jgi:LPS export ABC transporter protein LptC/lipopolysaccharide transport protein LptA